ncbi:hypothetical protein GF382_03370 [Candidatus Falkowbacteria bacterium]|nr:hypothetical protein [Candidatus Falkowbacteria bacterium]
MKDSSQVKADNGIVAVPKNNPTAAHGQNGTSVAVLVKYVVQKSAIYLVVTPPNKMFAVKSINRTVIFSFIEPSLLFWGLKFY